MALILLLDDDASVRRVISGMLRAAGHEVAEAGDGRAAAASMRARAPDLVITDIMMPDQDGIETIAMLRATSTVPIIAISGSAVTDDFDPLRDARLLGADVALPKPIARERLLSAVAEVLRAR